MDRVRKHLLPRRRLTEKLRRSGFRVVSVSSSEGFDLLVGGHVRVALRVAFPRVRSHSVTVRNKRYTYRYRSWHFNFHHHGRMDRRYADVFVCLAMDPRNPVREAIFVIPWAGVTGKTFSLHAARRGYKGKYAQYLGRWRIITDALAESQGRLRHVA